MTKDMTKDMTGKYVIIDKESEVYPDTLRNINKPPEKLYCIGDLSLLKARSAAIVGSRKYSLYGKKVAHMVGQKLAEGGVPVVSGLAYGIDTFAHEGTLDGGGKTIAVMGTGFEHMYPASNRELRNEIAQTGLLITEYAPEIPGSKFTFPERNRIISGLAEALVVIEAGLKSGSLLTAKYASDQGKTVYAVPGNINSQFSAGSNLLIRDGAKPLIVVSDLITDLGGLVRPVKEVMKERLGEDEEEIFDVVAASGGCTIDHLVHTLNKKASKINAILTVMEIKGVIETHGGKFYLTE